jgi:predicted ATPase/DNA-binding CsgD family transcriptional regulator
MPPATQVLRRTGQLPAETTGFVGRRSELATVSTLLAGSRLVTVTGAGGVGKTRLALRAASGAAARYRDGVALAELAGLRNPELLPHTVAAALGLARQDSRPRSEAIVDYLRERELLLILDTCEHVIDECALFAEAVLREAPGVTILATSRQPLDVPGESTCPLSPLQVPKQGDPPVAGDAVELFAQRAAAAAAGFEVTADNQEQVIKLCRQLDGIPLAIELAAVRLGGLDLSELGRRLEHRLQILDGGRHGTDDRHADDRHQALRDTIGWSYELCSGEEQTLWARLSVFAGPFTVQAAEEVCAGGDLPRGAVLGTVISLVDKSVLVRVDGPVPCYRMLDTIREYGAERLAATAESERIRGRMLRHYLRLAEELDADPLTGQLVRYRAMRAQHDNIWAALGYALGTGGREHAAGRLIAALYWYVLISGEYTEARYWLTRLLSRFPEPSAERAAGLLLEGLILTAQGTPETGLAECQEGLAMARTLGDAHLHARGHLYYCMALFVGGRPEEAACTARKADGLMRAAGDTPNAEVLCLYIGLTHLLTGDLDQAHAVGVDGLRRMPTGNGERWVSSFLLALVGLALFLKGEPDRGVDALVKFLEMRQELEDPMGMAFGLGLLGVMAASREQLDRTAWLMGAASQVWELLGTTSFTGIAGLDELTKSAAAQAREAMGGDAYAEAFRAGARQPLAEAVALVIRGAGAPPAMMAERLAGSRSPAIPLTSREQEIATMVSGGLSNREIAEHLVISKRTVDSHVEHIFAKLELSSRVQLTIWVREHLSR